MDTVGDREEGTLVAQWLEGTVVGRSGEIACTVLKQYILCTCRLRDRSGCKDTLEMHHS